MSARRGRGRDDRARGPAQTAPAAAAPGVPRWLVVGGLAALVVAATVVAYLPAIGGGFIWDDNMYVTGNTTLRTLDGLRRIWLEPTSIPQYYPLVHTTFWAEYQTWGGANPQELHLTNVLLHATSALLLWRVLVRLGVPGGWLAAALFALHPVEVESVAWITERKNVLSGVCYLAAALAYLRFDERRRAGWYALAFVLFVCALLSKTVTASLPVALGIVLWWRRGRLGVRDVVPLVPMVAVGAAMGATTAWLEETHVGAEGAEWAFTFVERCLIAGRALWFYLATLAWPAPLVFIYPRWTIDAGVWWQYLFPLAAAAAVIALWAARGRLGRGPLAAALFFGVTLVPALGFVNVFPMRFSFVADHFQYHASIGPLVLAAAAATTAATRLAWPVGTRAAGAAVVLGMLATLTWRQAHVYHDLETLYRDTLAKNPSAWMAHNNLGQILDRAGKFQEALDHFRETVRLFPDFPEGHNNLGAALEHLGKTEDALAEYREAVRLLPDYADGNYNLGRVLLGQGHSDEAIPYLATVTRVRPDFAPARRNLARALAATGHGDEAIAQYRESLRIEPGNAQAHLGLGTLLEQRHDVAAAIEQYAAAARLDPKLAEARQRLAAARAAAGGQ
jgi:protein O-mannosyl-transferase